MFCKMLFLVAILRLKKGLSCPVAILQVRSDPGNQSIINYLRKTTNKVGLIAILEFDIFKTLRKMREVWVTVSSRVS